MKALRPVQPKSRNEEGAGCPILARFFAQGWDSTVASSEGFSSDFGWRGASALQSLFDFLCWLYSLLRNSILFLPLGGAAVYRCDNHRISSAGFSR